jgi:hypothetical protein
VEEKNRKRQVSKPSGFEDVNEEMDESEKSIKENA